MRESLLPKVRCYAAEEVFSVKFLVLNLSSDSCKLIADSLLMFCLSGSGLRVLSFPQNEFYGYEN